MLKYCQYIFAEMVGENLYLSKIYMSFKKINLKGNPWHPGFKKKKNRMRKDVVVNIYEGCISENEETTKTQSLRSSEELISWTRMSQINSDFQKRQVFLKWSTDLSILTLRDRLFQSLYSYVFLRQMDEILWKQNGDWCAIFYLRTAENLFCGWTNFTKSLGIQKGIERN